MLVLDHVLWAAPDLDEGIAMIERFGGVRAAIGGSHPGRGTRNALLSLGETYFEIISADPAQDLTNNLGGTISALKEPALFTFAVKCSDLEAAKSAASGLNLPFQGPQEWSRTRPDGTVLNWRLAFMDGSKFGALLPLLIDWLDTPHPAHSTPTGMSLESLEVFHPEAEALDAVYRALGIEMTVRRSDKPGMQAVLASPLGELVLNC